MGFPGSFFVYLPPGAFFLFYGFLCGLAFFSCRKKVGSLIFLLLPLVFFFFLYTAIHFMLYDGTCSVWNILQTSHPVECTIYEKFFEILENFGSYISILTFPIAEILWFFGYLGPDPSFIYYPAVLLQFFSFAGFYVAKFTPIKSSASNDGEN